MSSGAWGVLVMTGLAVASLGFLVFTLARSIHDQRDAGRSIWREFGLGLALLLLFLGSWLGQAIAEWQVYTDEARSRGDSPELGDFVATFGQSTLENWQSEFLQLFAFVVLAALYIHKGSAESKDGSEKLEASLRRIEERLGTLPESAPAAPGRSWELPHTPLEHEDADGQRVGSPDG